MKNTFPSTIDPRIRHVQMLLKFFGPLADKKVLDVGCGKGRFARIAAGTRTPERKSGDWTFRRKCCGSFPPGIQTQAGSMTELPFADSTFDCVYATESLEHAVDIERAVAKCAAW